MQIAIIKIGKRQKGEEWNIKYDKNEWKEEEKIVYYDSYGLRPGNKANEKQETGQGHFHSMHQQNNDNKQSISYCQ